MGHGRLLAAACIDQRAECHDMSIWVLDSDHDEKQIIAKVWEFASKFTKRVSADWCIVITKLDSFCESELEGIDELVQINYLMLNMIYRMDQTLRNCARTFSTIACMYM